MHCYTCVQSANACSSVSTVCFCIKYSEYVTKTQQEKQRDKGLCLPEGIPTLWEKKYIVQYFLLSQKCLISFRGLLQAYLTQTHIGLHKLMFNLYNNFMSLHCLAADCCHVSYSLFLNPVMWCRIKLCIINNWGHKKKKTLVLISSGISHSLCLIWCSILCVFPAGQAYWMPVTQATPG